ncbi:MurR/RpiR family transcriptional regulator [Oceanobacillus sp. FSL W8-0428]|uniref:Transcriptional regulator n=1 Tax=Oceanobacillus sojae TaxID=582851 RepID=A0A511ZFE2_9BACI|nr:MurR/RpiR family transcriptional regulator [Oceanobacillus sojae]GEN86111.1 transcriptional regulator [Oceanobacillus sojae]
MADNLSKQINQNFNQLSENDKFILNYILQNKEICQYMNVSELAQRSTSSPASIVRLSKKLGYSGFSELKYQLKSEIDEESQINFDTSTYLDELQNDINITVKLFKQTDLSEQFALIHKSNNVYAYATGTAQKNMLNELNRYMLSINKNLIIIPSYSELEMVSSLSSDVDLLIIVSLSGDTNDLEHPLRMLKMKNIPILSITDIKNNKLANYSPNNLYYHPTGIAKKGNISKLSFVTLNVLIDLFFQEYVSYVSKKES